MCAKIWFEMEAGKLNVEDLIRVVKDHPDEYRVEANKKEREEAWRNVCKKYHDGYEASTDEEKLNSVSPNLFLF